MDLLKQITPAAVGAVTAAGAAIAGAIPPSADRAILYGALAALLSMAAGNRSRIAKLEATCATRSPDC